MKLETFTYNGESKAWSVETFPELDSEQTLVLVFGDASFYDNPEPVKELAKAYPNSHVMGCSTSGEIHGSTISDNSLSVAVTRFEKTILKYTSTTISARQDAATIAKDLADTLNADDLRGIFVLGSGLDVNFAALIREVGNLVSHKVVMSGGVAGDGDRFQRTWVLHDGAPAEQTLTAVGLYGDAINIGFGSEGGWIPSGIPMVITRSEDNVLYELNGRPALNFFKTHIKKYDMELAAATLLFPLAIRSLPNLPQHVVRTILAIDEKTGSMTFAGEIPQRYFAQFMSARNDQLVDGAKNAAEKAGNGPKADGPVLSVAISCVGRRLVMKDETDTELDAVLNILPENTQQVGFYSYGEICPVKEGKFSELHNQTMTLTTFSEKAG